MGGREMLRYFVALILLAAATLATAQNPGNRDYQLTVDVELVQLPVSVLDKKGVPVLGLQQEHFSVFEDKVQQNITLFKQEDIPLSIGLVVDASSSMATKRDRLHTAAMTFVRESNPEDETAIVSFGDEVNLELDFTKNQRQLSRTLAGIYPNGSTALYDGVVLGAKHLKQEGSEEKRVLLVISDGEDNRSKYKLNEALEAVRESKIIVYSIGLLSTDVPYSYYGMYSDRAKKALKQFAEVSGGAAYFPKKVSDVEEICRRIARELRNQYTVGYKPSNEKLDGSWRNVQVKVSPPKTASNIKVRTKQGYYAPVTRDARGSAPTVK
jgi:VWFA-related protein